ncbi:guanine nucleotide-binding protein G(s) subunit alpha-like [Gigantopelta aegis]|uniref:guanine nucleotide-binding protein G(s) subunit alpha-like n=1 Tax=Gigantopelta aegis TaxID=1735272 RepID=UPI001B88DC84|nr:guanine nucleotide-binding protein G(s) subunit alpha-like [Gigantopelta aegis]
MLGDVMASCFGTCADSRAGYYQSREERKLAEHKDKQLTKLLQKYHKQDLKRLKLLLLGTGESGKSTITKQMKIIHINGFDQAERIAKKEDIKRNIKDSILAVVVAMQYLGLSLQNPNLKGSVDYIIQAAENETIDDEFLKHAERLWPDGGVQESFNRSHEYQLIDCAFYFLDKIADIRQPDYIPSDQDILHCRVITTSIQNIEFDVHDAGELIRFSVYDVGGQRGERKKWIQVFDSVVAILFLVDTTSYDQTLREDPDKNRLIESLEIFEQVWNNRFLRHVSLLIFFNKIDLLVDKIARRRTMLSLCEQYPDTFQDFLTWEPTNSDKLEFVDAFSSGQEGHKKKGRQHSRTDIDPEVTKTAVYIRRLFWRMTTGQLRIRSSIYFSDRDFKDWHQYHSCGYYYTCAVDTNNIRKVLEGCKTLIIRKHLERFGII